jgi:hypothetical protein
MIVTPQLAEMVALSHGFDCVVDWQMVSLQDEREQVTAERWQV